MYKSPHQSRYRRSQRKSHPPRGRRRSIRPRSKENEMNVYRFLALASGIVATLIVGMPTIFAEEASTSATSDAALHTPQHCDLSLSLSDVMKIKAPKAKKSYKISFSLISLAGYFFQAAAY